MLEWYAVYKENPLEEIHTDEPAPPATVLKRFEDAAKLGMHNGRAVVGMWLVEPQQRLPDVVLAIHGEVPPHIYGLHGMHLREREKPRR